MSVAAAVAAIGAAVAVTTGFGWPGSGDGDPARSSLPPATAQVTRQTLVETQTESGELGYGDTTKLYGRLPGTVTALPAVGATLSRGQVLYRVDDTPVVLLYGTMPAYRTLSTGAQGTDVKQFEKNLHALGYRGFTVDETYSASTASAVRKWQGDLGLPKTGTVEPGRISYATGAVRVDSLTAAVGDAGQPGTAVLAYTGTTQVVTVELEVSDQRLARKGAEVEVVLPDGRATSGKITRILTTIKPAEGQNATKTTLLVTVSVDDQQVLATLAQATVTVGFTAAQRENVLTVPVAALLALAEGGYGLQVVEESATRIVTVQTGLFAGGRVEVSGPGLTEGMTVGMPA
ncbi:peptidoglycan-binding protein [Micromonospora sonneratiae]